MPLIASEFGRHVVAVMTGATLAQAIPIALSPILTRLYSPEDFGLFSLFLALLATLGAVSSLRYELAITLPLKQEDASLVLVASVLICFAISLLMLPIVHFFGVEIADSMGNRLLAPWLYLLPVSILVSGVLRSAIYWLNRNKNFWKISCARFIQSTSTGVMQIGLSAGGGGGLIAGTVAGQAVALGCAMHFIGWTQLLDFFRAGCFKSVIRALKNYIRFPVFQAPATLIEACSSQVPVFLLSAFFGPASAGFYALSQRVIRVPIAVISNSFGDVFRQKASEDYAKNGNARGIFIKVLVRLFLISLVPFSVFLLFSPWLFSLIFGEQWRTAGVYAQIMTPLFWLSFIVSPLSVMFIVAERQNIDLIMQLLLLLLSVSSLVVGYIFFDSETTALTLFTLVYCSKYIVELFLSYKFCAK